MQAIISAIGAGNKQICISITYLVDIVTRVIGKVGNHESSIPLGANSILAQAEMHRCRLFRGSQNSPIASRRSRRSGFFGGRQWILPAYDPKYRLFLLPGYIRDRSMTFAGTPIMRVPELSILALRGGQLRGAELAKHAFQAREYHANRYRGHPEHASNYRAPGCAARTAM